MTRIIRIFELKDQFKQKMVLVDKFPDFKYERKGKYLIAEQDGFYSCYNLHHDRFDKAFAGREFDIELKDGGVEKASGQWWYCLPPNHEEDGVVSMGVSDPGRLLNCFVFTGIHMKSSLLAEAKGRMVVQGSDAYQAYQSAMFDLQNFQYREASAQKPKEGGSS